SAMVELRPAEVLAHHLENYLRVIRQRDIELTNEGIDVLMDGTRLLETVINAHRFDRPQPPIDDVVVRVERLAAGPRTAPRIAAEGAERSAADASADAVRHWLCTFVP